jgi:N-acetylmuramoyl-L-alanine amidase
MKIVISSGHGKYIRGASGDPVPPQLDEVDEARRVVNKVAHWLEEAGVDTTVFHDDVSQTQNENLNRIVDFHNAQGRHDYDVSVHFNAYDGSASGTECLYVSQSALAADMAGAIAGAGGFINRGPKKRTDLFFLNNTVEKSILIEVCFCDSDKDSELYTDNFEEICKAIAEVLSGEEAVDPVPPVPEPIPGALFQAKGRCSWFGGPDDDGVSADEGLAFIYEYDEAPHLFLPYRPDGTTGLARRLNPSLFYIACRWDYDVTSKEALANPSVQALVRAKGKEFLAWPADWGPHGDTNRIADLSPGLMAALDLMTDDTVEVIYPAQT